MKDEEMAEEYSQKICGYVRVELAQAFLAGLKAGRPQWHKVADGDLPKYDILGDSVSITVLNQNGNKVFYNFLEKVWKLELNNKISKVISWCEIPTFDKE